MLAEGHDGMTLESQREFFRAAAGYLFCRAVDAHGDRVGQLMGELDHVVEMGLMLRTAE